MVTCMCQGLAKSSILQRCTDQSLLFRVGNSICYEWEPPPLSERGYFFTSFNDLVVYRCRTADAGNCHNVVIFSVKSTKSFLNLHIVQVLPLPIYNFVLGR